jgi:hypothetical protein
MVNCKSVNGEVSRFVDVSQLAFIYQITPNPLQINEINIGLNYGNDMFLGLTIYACALM